LEFEGTILYLHEEDHRRALVKNGIWLHIDRSKFSSWQPGYAVVEGNFAPDNHGHMGLFAGALTDVQRLSAWHSPQ